MSHQMVLGFELWSPIQPWMCINLGVLKSALEGILTLISQMTAYEYFRAREVTRWVKHLPSKCESCVWNPQPLSTPKPALSLVILGLLWQDRRWRVKNPQKLLGQQETLSLIRWTANTNTQGCSLTSIHMYKQKYTTKKSRYYESKGNI